jgi:hypothetical protein
VLSNKIVGFLFWCVHVKVAKMGSRELSRFMTPGDSGGLVILISTFCLLVFLIIYLIKLVKNFEPNSLILY